MPLINAFVTTTTGDFVIAASGAYVVVEREASFTGRAGQLFNRNGNLYNRTPRASYNRVGRTFTRRGQLSHRS